MKEAVIFGAGNIGRGFIGQLMTEGGYHTTFIDVAKPVVDRINQDHCYPIRIVSDEGTEDRMIQNVSAVDGNDRVLAPRIVADADIAATCVGAKAIPYILPNFCDGIKLRAKEGKGPLNLLICENLMDADKYIDGLLKDRLTPEERELVGLVETSVGRMVPVPKPETTADHPLRICVERYGVLPVDKDAFKGEIPEIPHIVPFSPFHFYIERKLYLHKMGHAVCAYLGDALGISLICDAIRIPEIRLLVREAMIESALALSDKYDVPSKDLLSHSADLIYRFANRQLGDTCARVGADIPRKLALSDRLVGCALNIEKQGKQPVYVTVGIGAALCQYEKEPGAPETFDASKTLSELSGLDEDSPIFRNSLVFYRLLKEKKDLSEVLRVSDGMVRENEGMIV